MDTAGAEAHVHLAGPADCTEECEQGVHQVVAAPVDSGGTADLTFDVARSAALPGESEGLPGANSSEHAAQQAATHADAADALQAWVGRVVHLPSAVSAELLAFQGSVERLASAAKSEHRVCVMRLEHPALFGRLDEPMSTDTKAVPAVLAAGLAEPSAWGQSAARLEIPLVAAAVAVVAEASPLVSPIASRLSPCCGRTAYPLASCAPSILRGVLAEGRWVAVAAASKRSTWRGKLTCNVGNISDPKLCELATPDLTCLATSTCAIWESSGKIQDRVSNNTVAERVRLPCDQLSVEARPDDASTRLPCPWTFLLLAGKASTQVGGCFSRRSVWLSTQASAPAFTSSGSGVR